MSSQPEKMVCRGLGGSEGCGGVGGVGVGLWHELARFNNLYCMYKYHKAFPNCPYFFFNLATWEYFNNCSIWWRFRKRSTYLSDAYASDGGWGIKKFFKKNYDNSVFKQWNARAGKKKKKRFYHVTRWREMLRLYQKGIAEIEGHSSVSTPMQPISIPAFRKFSFDAERKDV